jgi:rod shape determining protein RodA
MNNYLNKKKKTFNTELKILIPSIVIAFLGLVTLLSTTILPDGTFGDRTIVIRQIIFILAGYFFYFIISKLDLSYSKYWQVIIPIYVLTIISLILVILVGPVINNVQRWLLIGGIQIQPSEFAKITIILTTAYIFSFKDRYNQWLLFLLSFVILIPIVYLLYLEPDGSMSILITMIWFFVAFTGLDNQLRNSISLIIILLSIIGFLLSAVTGSLYWLILVLISLILSIFAFYYRDEWKILVVVSFLLSIVLGITSTVIWDNVLRDYQKERIEVFLDPSKDTGDAGFNVNQAKIAIGSGKIFGKGFGNGTQSKRNFLPEYRTDFIFASYAEEFGLLGSVLLLTLFAVIITTSINKTIALGNNHPYFAMIMIGITVKLLLEVFINIGTNTGVIPATGIPLPLVSAGGSNVLVTLFSLGVIQSIISHSTQVEDTDSIVESYEK